MRRNGIDLRSVFAVASIDIKKQEQGIIDFANTLQVPFLTFSSEELNSQLRANMQRYEADAHEGVLQPNTYREMFSDDMSALSKFQRIAVWLVDPLFRFLF